LQLRKSKKRDHQEPERRPSERATDNKEVMPYRRVAVGVGIVSMTAGAAGVAASFATVSKLGASTLLLIFGVYILGWSGLTMVFHKVTKPADDAYHLGHQIGYEPRIHGGARIGASRRGAHGGCFDVFRM